MGAARRPRKRCSRPGIAILGSVAVAPPGYHVDLFVHVGLRLCRGVAGDHVQVFGEGDLGAVDVLVVGLEGGWVDLGVGFVVGAGDVVERWGPFSDFQRGSVNVS